MGYASYWQWLAGPHFKGCCLTCFAVKKADEEVIFKALYIYN